MSDDKQKPILFGPDGKPISVDMGMSEAPTEQKLQQKKDKRSSLHTGCSKRLISISVSVFLALCTIAGLALYFVPRVSVTPEGPVELADPFSASFTITSSSIFPLRNVGACIGLIQLITLPGSFNEEKRPRIADIDKLSCFTEADWNHHNLSMDEKFTVTPYTTFVPLNQFAVVSGADIAIVVDYQPWFIAITRRQAFRFVTHRFSGGNYRWYSYPMD